MNETSWQTGADGEEMLEFVADRLSPRQWLLASAAYARKLWDGLPTGTLRQAIDFVELTIEPLTPEVRAEWLSKIEAAVPDAVETVVDAQRAVVKSADPDAASIADPILTRPNQIAPAFPLFQAASRHAANAIEWIGEAVREAADALRVLFREPNELMFEEIRALVEQATDTRTRANVAANNSLFLKSEGDELADRAAGAKNKRVVASEAIEIVRRLEEGESRSQEDEFDAETKRDHAAAKHLARVLREIVGNAFAPPRCEPAWLTSDVKLLAQSIYTDRAFDRMISLADALLDADCDEEAILRHCRGTERGLKEQVQHIRGCWVIELILGRYVPLPPAPLEKKPKRRRSLEDDIYDFGSLRDDDTRLA